MRYVKTLGLAGVAVVAMLVVAGSASATELTSPAGAKVEVGMKIKAEAEEPIQWNVPLGMSCSSSILEGKITNAGGSGSTVSGQITTLTFTECGQEPGKISDTVFVLTPGTFELHGNGTLTWSGGEITVLTHRGAGLFKLTSHCQLKSENTDLGTLTGSNATKGTATLDVESGPIPQSSPGCNAEIFLSGSYKITSPDYLSVDADEASPGSTLTSPGGTKLGAESEIKAESESAIEFGTATPVSCQKSTLEGKISNAGGESAKASVSLSSFTFSECGNNTVEVKRPGSLKIDGITSTNNGTLTSTGTEITALTHSIFFGTRHCIYVTDGTHIGTITGSKGTGGTATIDIGPAELLTLTTDEACGDNVEWGGSYKITSPDYLDVDQT